MKQAIVKVEVKKNWAGDKYVTFSTDEHGQIAELDFPNKERPTRVYAKNVPDNGYVTFSCAATGVIGAETAVQVFLLDYEQYPKYEYPAEIKKLRKEAFKMKM